MGSVCLVQSPFLRLGRQHTPAEKILAAFSSICPPAENPSREGKLSEGRLEVLICSLRPPPLQMVLSPRRRAASFSFARIEPQLVNVHGRLSSGNAIPDTSIRVERAPVYCHVVAPSSNGLLCIQMDPRRTSPVFPSLNMSTHGNFRSTTSLK